MLSTDYQEEVVDIEDAGDIQLSSLSVQSALSPQYPKVLSASADDIVYQYIQSKPASRLRPIIKSKY